jgi:3-oxoisoapionate decarboxylase
VRLGISSYTFVWAVGVPGYPVHQPLTMGDLLSKAIDLGVHVVQIADNLPIHNMSDEALDALARRATEARIDLELGTCGIESANLLNYLRLATKLRSPILRTVIDTADSQPTFEETVTALAPLMPDFERAGVHLAIENHDRFEAATLASILEQVDSPNIGICLDTANSIGCVENVDTLLRILGHKVVNLHIKDFVVFRPAHLKGFVVEGRPAGQGQLDIPHVLSELKMSGRDVNAILELWPPPEPNVAESIAKEEKWARQSVGYLRRFIAD